MSETAAIIRVEDLAKSFGRGRKARAALAGLSFEVGKGRLIGLFGPDGAGKTTLMRLLAGLLLPDRGRIFLFGEDLGLARERLLSRIAYMPQRFGLYEDLTVAENMALYADLTGLPPDRRAARSAELLERTGLAPFGKRLAGKLSGGMKQKLGLACALLRVPDLLLLDEPTVGVDPLSRRELWAIIRAMHAEGSTILVSTSYLDEADHCDDVMILEEGRLRLQGAPARLAAALAPRAYALRHPTLDRRALQAAISPLPEVIESRIESEGLAVLFAGPTPPPLPEGTEIAPRPPRFADVFADTLHAARRRPALAAPPPPGKAAGGEVVLRVAHLNRFFGDFHAVRDVTFDVRRGEVFGLLGANGAGKTTTFRMLCGLLPASSGHLEVEGENMLAAPAAARAKLGYVAQKFSLYGMLSVAQNLAFFASAYGLSGARRRARLAWAEESFDLGPYLDINAADLPLGYKQRLALACALLHEPPVLFLDEATSGVDPLTRAEFWQRINQLAAAGTTVLVTTHFMEEAEYCDRIALLWRGAMLALGTPREVRARAASPGGPLPSMDEAFVILMQQAEESERESPPRRSAA
jgi:ABC-2 type transport system ATP-binding protein